jgi:hypothetical protein
MIQSVVQTVPHLSSRGRKQHGGRKSVLALQAVATMTAGDVPFYMLAQLGGPNVMRGDYEGRYRDRELLAVQLEYRFPILWRFGGTAFAGIGMVRRRSLDSASVL